MEFEALVGGVVACVWEVEGGADSELFDPEMLSRQNEELNARDTLHRTLG